MTSRNIRCIAVLLFVVLLFVGCTVAQTPDTELDETTNPVTTQAPETEAPLSERLSGYTLVRPDVASAGTIDALVELSAALKAEFGLDLALTTDWVQQGSDPDAAGEREILVGATNRTASAKAAEGLGLMDYALRMDGEDIVVAAGGDYALGKAVKQLVALLAEGRTEVEYTYLYEEHKQEDDMNLRVASFNIKHGAQVNMNMQILADDICGLAIDVVGLQEVDINCTRSGEIDTMALLSEASGMQYHAFAKGIALGDGEYGTGILSRYPIVSFEVTELESGDKEQRSIGHAVLDVNGKLVHFFNTHLSYESKSLRTAQFAQIAEMLPKDAPYVLTGDFNTADFTEFDVLNSTLVNNKENRLPSFYSSGTAIDNIVISDNWAVVESGMPRVKHSDHYMIWCELADQQSAE